METTLATARVYVACLASYNSGVLHGEWIDCDAGADHIHAEVRKMLRASPYPNVRRRDWTCNTCAETWTNDASTAPLPCRTCGARLLDLDGSESYASAEEWAIHDHEYFRGVKVEEWDSFDRLADLSDALDEHGAPFAAWLAISDESEDIAESLVSYAEAYAGEADTDADFAEEFHDSCGDLQDVPAWLAYHIDWASVFRDMEGVTVVRFDGTNYYFWNV